MRRLDENAIEEGYARKTLASYCSTFRTFDHFCCVESSTSTVDTVRGGEFWVINDRARHCIWKNA
jgi:hypothetical protein